MIKNIPTAVCFGRPLLYRPTDGGIHANADGGRKNIPVTTYRESDANGIAARAFYKHLSFSEGKLTEESRQELAQTMDRSVERMAAAFELLECGVWQPIIESVVYAGLYQVGNAVLNGTFHQRPRREKYPERKAGHGDA